MKLEILIFLSSLSHVYSSGYQCRGPIELNPPTDLSKTIYWPSIWNDSMPPIPFASQQKCTWEINIPDGLYATAVFYKNAPSTVSIAVEYSNLEIEGLDNNDLNPYIFTSPKFSINLYKSAQEGAFSFKILWSKYPAVPHETIPLVKGDKPVAIIPTPQLTTFTSDSTVSLVAFDLKNQSHYPLLRQTAIYDGDSTCGKFLGTLYRVMIQRKEILSSGKALTVYTWGLDQFFDYTLFMVQNHAGETPSFSYSGVNCNSGSDCVVRLSANYGTDIKVTAGGFPVFITDFGPFPEGATLKIYEGAVNNQTLVTTLTKNNYKSRLPMELKNTLQQYVLDSKTLNMQISYNGQDTNWNKMYDGRKGFIHSLFHGVESDQQYTDEVFTTFGNTQLFLNYIVRDVDFTGDYTKLVITVVSKGQLVANEIYSTHNPPPTTTTSISGDGYSVKYETNGFATKGFRVDFSTTNSGYTPPPTPTTKFSKSSLKTTMLTTNSDISSSTQNTLFYSSSSSSAPAQTTKTTNVMSTGVTQLETTTKSSLCKSFILGFASSLLFVI